MEKIKKKLIEHDRRFDEHDRRFNQIYQKLESHDNKFDRIDDQLEFLAHKMLKHDDDIEYLKENMATKDDIRGIRGILDDIMRYIKKHDEELTMQAHGIQRLFDQYQTLAT